MEEYRKIIDEIDDQIMKLLVDRLLIVKDIGLYKKRNKIPIFDPGREQLIFDKIDKKYNQKEENTFVKNIYCNMMLETKKIQYPNTSYLPQ